MSDPQQTGAQPQIEFNRLEGRAIYNGIKAASTLYTTHYGRWGPRGPRPRRNMIMTPIMLRYRCLPADFISPSGNPCALVRAIVDERYGGHAIACIWDIEGLGKVCWITQLVVHQLFRSRGVSTALLGELKRSGDAAGVSVYGMLSAHPHALCAAARVFAQGIIDLQFIRDTAPQVVVTTPLEYLKAAKLRGDIFEDDSEGDGCVCAAETGFLGDLEEVERLRRHLGQQGREWAFGSLREGCEYLWLARVTTEGESAKEMVGDVGEEGGVGELPPKLKESGMQHEGVHVEN